MTRWPLCRGARKVGGDDCPAIDCTLCDGSGEVEEVPEDPLARAVDEGRQDAAAYMRRVRRMWGAGEG